MEQPQDDAQLPEAAELEPRNGDVPITQGVQPASCRRNGRRGARTATIQRPNGRGSSTTAAAAVAGPRLLLVGVGDVEHALRVGGDLEGVRFVDDVLRALPAPRRPAHWHLHPML